MFCSLKLPTAQFILPAVCARKGNHFECVEPTPMFCTCKTCEIKSFWGLLRCKLKAGWRLNDTQNKMLGIYNRSSALLGKKKKRFVLVFKR